MTEKLLDIVADDLGTFVQIQLLVHMFKKSRGYKLSNAVKLNLIALLNNACLTDREERFADLS